MAKLNKIIKGVSKTAKKLKKPKSFSLTSINKFWLIIGIVIIIGILIIIFLVPKIRKEGFQNSSEIDLTNFEEKVYSQNGEDGITKKLIELIYDNPNNKYYVEFGVEDGSECITRILREKFNWTGLMMDGTNENPSINLKKEFITKENVVDLFKKHGVPNHINLLCVDIDGNDFYCLNQILKKYKCDIIVCEYNATHLPNEDKVIIYDNEFLWDRTNYFGTSLGALNTLCKKYGYTLVYCDNKGVNSFFVNDEIIKNRDLKIKNIGDINNIYKKPGYGSGPNGGHTADSKNRKYITCDEALKN